MLEWRRARREAADELTVIDARGAPTSFAEVLAGWRDDAAFRASTTSAFAEGSARAYFLEMPRLDGGTAALPFQCRLVDGDASPWPRADPSAFAAQLAGDARGSVARFRNLGGDATLLVPRSVSPSADYGHAAAFFRTAPAHQRDELLGEIGAFALETLSERPLWISTAGLGLPWLHVRFDARPKYYRTRAYRDAARRPEPGRG